MSKIEYEVFAHNNCGSGPCPTVYKTKDGRYFVQGYNVSKDVADNFSPPEGEYLVEVDEALIMNIMNKS